MSMLHEVFKNNIEKIFEEKEIWTNDGEREDYDEFLHKLDSSPLTEYCYVPFSMTDNKSVGDLICMLLNREHTYTDAQVLTILFMFNGLAGKYVRNTQKWEINNRGKDYKLANGRVYDDNIMHMLKSLPLFIYPNKYRLDSVEEAMYNIIRINNNTLIPKSQDISFNNIFQMYNSNFNNFGSAFPIILDFYKLLYEYQLDWSQMKDVRKGATQAGHIKTTDMSVGTQRKKAISNKLTGLDLSNAKFDSLTPKK